MPGSNGGPEAKRRAVEGLLAGQTIVRAAEGAHVHERTVRRWLDDPAFRAHLDDARFDQTQRVAAALTSAATVAVAVLARIASDSEVHVSVRGRGAGRLLSVGPLWVSLAVLDDRIREVERALPRPSQSTELRSVQ